MGKTTLVNGLFTRLCRFTRRLGGNERGNVAMIFAFSLPVLAMISLGGIDYQRASTARSNLQDALDAATLAAARAPTNDAGALNQIGRAALRANLAASQTGAFNDSDATFTLDANQVVIAEATMQVNTLIANVVLPPYGRFFDDQLPVTVHSEVNRASKNIEVALVLDVTGSMRGRRIADLKDAARQLVEIVVQDEQEPFYSRMAIIPYSSGVNLNSSRIGAGDYRALARGAPPAPVRITNAAWMTGSSMPVSSINRSSGTVTATRHGFSKGDYVWLRDVRDMNGLNNRAYRVGDVTRDTLELQTFNGSNWFDIDTRSYSRNGSSGSLSKCLLRDCFVVITANNHRMRATDPDTGDAGSVYIEGVNGMDIQGGYEIANVTANTFSINKSGPFGSFRTGAEAFCGNDGCKYRVFRSVNGSLLDRELSDCVTERTGGERYTETTASTAHVGRLYPSGSGENMCTQSSVLPLGHNRDDMNSLIGVSSNVSSGLQAGGFTAGHIGLAWGWYAVSPEFGSFWPTAPAAYDTNRTLKAVILMTDGEFNMNHCSGVMARNSGGGGDRIDCDAPNGSSFTQARELCAAMKRKGVVLYTVGFQVSSTSSAGRFLSECATSNSHAFIAASGADLSESFRAIGRDITRLRISK